MKRILSDLARLPSGQSLREARVRNLKVGPPHIFLEKVWTEPRLVGEIDQLLST
jgi:hypothetical protein